MVNEPTGKSSGNTIPEMAQLAKLIMKMGPDIDLIARLSGQYKETIRYRYKEKILGKGFALQARLNFEGMGLKRVVMTVRLGEMYEPYAKEVFVAMNKLCFLTSFSSLMPQGAYMLHATVPEEMRGRFTDLMKQLQDLGIFTSMEFYNFDWFRNVPMRAEYYDFEHGIWEFEWDKPVETGKTDHESGYEPFTFDKIDLLILKELQIDSTRSLSDIREAIKEKDGNDINYKTLAWHWIRHVQDKRMINGYALRWTGTKYDSGSEKARHRQHRYVGVPILVRGVSDAERVSLISEMNKVPFIWSEAAGEDYYAQFAFPVDMVNDAFVFLKNILSPYGSRATSFLVDQTNSAGFTISFQLFDAAEKEWKFEEHEVLLRFQNLIMKIGESSGTARNSNQA
jgi:hypothetical protein